MSFVVVLTVDNIDLVQAVLDAWEAAGAPGVTILTSSGLGRVRKAGLRDDLPLMPSLSDLLKDEERHHRTLYAVVPTEDMADRLIDAAQAVIGDLDSPDTGFLFVMPVLKTAGLNRKPL